MKNIITYGQRIAIGGILADATEVNSTSKVVKILDTIYPETVHTAKDIFNVEKLKKAQAAIDAVQYWSNAEREILHYTPSPEEQRANIKAYTEKVGEIGTVNAIAEQFAQDPDTVLNWKYAKVFGILLYNQEKAAYQKRLQAQGK